jgi:hypothetical protein
MRMTTRLVRHVAGAVALMLGVSASASSAQGSGDGFLLHTPHGSLAIRAGYDHARAGSDIFAQNVTDLTLSKNSFSGLSFGADVSVHLRPRLDVVFGTSYAGSSARSEFRSFIDNNNQGIAQTTTLQRVAVGASLKSYLTSTGRSIGRFAWIPSKVAPYVGAGGGALWYRYRQSGDFVDFATTDLNVFNRTLSSSAWTPEAHVMGGLDYSLTPRLALTGEARYTWARAPMGSQFSGFDKIDLTGIAGTAGLSIRF